MRRSRNERSSWVGARRPDLVFDESESLLRALEGATPVNDSEPEQPLLIPCENGKQRGMSGSPHQFHQLWDGESSGTGQSSFHGIRPRRTDPSTLQGGRYAPSPGSKRRLDWTAKARLGQANGADGGNAVEEVASRARAKGQDGCATTLVGLRTRSRGARVP